MTTIDIAMSVKITISIPKEAKRKNATFIICLSIGRPRKSRDPCLIGEGG